MLKLKISTFSLFLGSSTGSPIIGKGTVPDLNFWRLWALRVGATPGALNVGAIAPQKNNKDDYTLMDVLVLRGNAQSKWMTLKIICMIIIV